MSLLGQFAAPVGAMMAQSKALETIGLNIANMNTGGYKRSETSFQTILSNTYDHNRDIGGVKAYTKSIINDQGVLQSSSSEYDLAINGNGFFVLNSSSDGSGTTFYGRDGQLEQALGPDTGLVDANGVAVREGYLVDKNGYFLQGWPVAADGITFPTDEGSLESIRVDPAAFTNTGQATSLATIGLNVPGDANDGYIEATTIQAYDSSGAIQSFELRWNKQADANEWNLEIYDGTTALQLDPLDVYDATTEEIDPATLLPIAGTGVSGNGGDLDTTTLMVTFNGDATINTPQSLVITGVNNDASFTLDMSEITQFSSNKLRELTYDFDGASDAVMTGFEFTNTGTVMGRFSDSTSRPLYKLPLANFTNVNGLEPVNGNVYKVSFESGEAAISTAGGDGFGEFVPFAHELSNVDLEDEFTRMMITQQAYNTASTVFKTVNEMSEVARDLKR